MSSDERFLPGDVREHQNKGKGDEIPEEFQVLLAELHFDEIRSLHDAMQNEHTARWLESAESLRKEASA